MTRLVVRNCSVLVVPEAGECRVDAGQDIHVEDGVITAVTPTGASDVAVGEAEPAAGAGRGGGGGRCGGEAGGQCRGRRWDRAGCGSWVGQLAYAQSDGDDAGCGRRRRDRRLVQPEDLADGAEPDRRAGPSRRATRLRRDAARRSDHLRRPLLPRRPDRRSRPGDRYPGRPRPDLLLVDRRRGPGGCLRGDKRDPRTWTRRSGRRITTRHRQPRPPRDLHSDRRRPSPYCGSRASRRLPDPPARGRDRQTRPSPRWNA